MESRDYDRRFNELRITIRVAGKEYEGVTTDYSHVGMGILTTYDMEAGARRVIDVRVTHPSGVICEVRGRILRMDRDLDPRFPCAYGLRLESTDRAYESLFADEGYL